MEELNSPNYYNQPQSLKPSPPSPTSLNNKENNQLVCQAPMSRHVDANLNGDVGVVHVCHEYSERGKLRFRVQGVGPGSEGICRGRVDVSRDVKKIRLLSLERSSFRLSLQSVVEQSRGRARSSPSTGARRTQMIRWEPGAAKRWRMPFLHVFMVATTSLR